MLLPPPTQSHNPETELKQIEYKKPSADPALRAQLPPLSKSNVHANHGAPWRLPRTQPIIPVIEDDEDQTDVQLAEEKINIGREYRQAIVSAPLGEPESRPEQREEKYRGVSLLT